MYLPHNLLATMISTKTIALFTWLVIGSSLGFAPSPFGRVHHLTYHADALSGEVPTDPTSQNVGNPFKNRELMITKDGQHVDPARILGKRLNGVNLYLIGMMGSGKTAVGDLLAKRMGMYNFLDTDDVIEQVTGVTIPEIFEKEGEEGFRAVEAEVLDSLHSYVRCVVSTGGGIVTRVENWAKLQSGLVVWLDVDPETIIERIQGTDRPLLQCDNPLQKLKDLLNERQDKYNESDLAVEVTANMPPADVADSIVRKLHSFIDDNPPAWQRAKKKAQSDGLDWVQ